MYVAHLIGHEGKGSLLSLLRDRGWCSTLNAGPSLGAKGFMFFMVNVDLTEDGEGEMFKKGWGKWEEVGVGGNGREGWNLKGM